MPTVATTIVYASIAQYLAANQNAKRMLLQGGSKSPIQRLSRMLYIVRKAVDFNYQRDSTDPTLIPTSNYLYWLSGIYNAQAAVIIGNGGSGTIISPTTGTSSTILAYNLQFVVGEVGSPMIEGDTQLVIVLTGFIENSVDIALDGVDLPQNRTDRWSYTVDYSNPSQITIVFNQGLMGVTNGQLFEIKGLRLQPIATPAASETYFEVATYADMIALCVGNYNREFLVLNDENKSTTRTRYEYWPATGKIEYLAAVDEV